MTDKPQTTWQSQPIVGVAPAQNEGKSNVLRNTVIGLALATLVGFGVYFRDAIFKTPEPPKSPESAPTERYNRPYVQPYSITRAEVAAALGQPVKASEVQPAKETKKAEEPKKGKEAKKGAKAQPETPPPPPVMSEPVEAYEVIYPFYVQSGAHNNTITGYLEPGQVIIVDRKAKADGVKDKDLVKITIIKTKTSTTQLGQSAFIPPTFLTTEKTKITHSAGAKDPSAGPNPGQITLTAEELAVFAKATGQNISELGKKPALAVNGAFTVREEPSEFCLAGKKAFNNDKVLILGETEKGSGWFKIAVVDFGSRDKTVVQGYAPGRYVSGWAKKLLTQSK